MKYRLLRHVARWVDRYLARRGFMVSVTTLPASADRLICSPAEADYVGSLADALSLAHRGIKPEKIASRCASCTIGFCQREQKWYGWSHRAIYGFGVGSVVDSDSHLCAEELGVGFRAATLADARRMAAAFAESVS